MPRQDLTQANKEFSVITPLGEDVLLFHAMSASEELGRMFQFELSLLSSNPQIKIQDILGQNVAVKCELEDNKVRHFNGCVVKFSQSGSHGDLFMYQATLMPWIWFLTRTADCRAFQKMTVPDIVKEIFREHGFSDFEELLSNTYREWDYCTQYRETDFNFVSRLMEQEGIYYYFRHEEGKHILVLADAITSHDVVPSYEEVPFYPQDKSVQRETGHIYNWTLCQTVQPCLYALSDFDFEAPKADLQVKSQIKRDHAHADFEIYDYPGEYGKTDEGDSYVRTRIEELQSQYEKVDGEGTVRGLTTGCLFKLVYHPREDQNREYLVTASAYDLGPQEYESIPQGDLGSTFSCQVTAIEKDQVFRTSRTTPKPVVQGPQTAIVVGPAGEEIWTDKHGRVKVQFHWDRYGKKDEESSCWVRVSQAWAGSGWGSMHIPHIGHEVIVSFIEGDPDRPIVTGRVYNGANAPPDSLPAEHHKNVVRSFGDNDIVIEDKEGDKHIQIKQACGNEILMHETTPNIEIKQECGNEILMRESEGIQIRDSFGNEIVMDSVAGTMKMRSPSHESYIELGNSIWWGTISDAKKTIEKDETSWINGSAFQVINGSLEQAVAGPVRLKWDGFNANIHGGVVEDMFIGAKFVNMLSYTHTYGYGKEFKKNFADRDKKIDGHYYMDSEKYIHLIGGSGDQSTLMLDKDKAEVISAQGAKITIHKSGHIVIDTKGSGGTIQLNGGGNIHLETKGQIQLNADSVHIRKGKVIHANIEVGE